MSILQNNHHLDTSDTIDYLEENIGNKVKDVKTGYEYWSISSGIASNHEITQSSDYFVLNFMFDKFEIIN